MIATEQIDWSIALVWAYFAISAAAVGIAYMWYKR